MNITDVKQRLSTNIPLKEKITNLISFLTYVKKLSFSKEEYTDVDLLQKENIISLKGNVYSVSDYTTLAFAFVEHYQNKSGFKYSNDFWQTIQFLKEVKEDFLSNGYIQQFYHLKKELWKIAIYEVNHLFVVDFSAFLKDIESSEANDEVFDFLEALTDILSELNINIEVLYKNAQLLKVLSDENERFRIYFGKMLMALKKEAEKDNDNGMELFKLALDDSEYGKDLIIAIIVGLYNKNGYPFYNEHLKSLYEKNDFKLPVIKGLSQIDKVEEKEVKLFLEIYDKEKDNEESFGVILELLFSILKNGDFSGKENYVTDIFFRINEIVLKGDAQLAYFILHEIAFLHKYDEERINIVNAIICQPYFSLDKYGKAIEQIFWYLKNINLLKQVIVTIADKCPLERLTEFCSIDSNGFNTEDYDTMLIEFITCHKANIRFIGLEIYSQHTAGHKFIKNILDLPSIAQYKLWVGLTQDYKEPKYLIPSLIPLLDSESEIVKEAFICKLEEYTENYGQQIVEILEQYTDKSNPLHPTIIERVKNYMEDFYAKNILLKKEIQELNPYYTHNKLFTNFNRLYYKTFNNRMQKSVGEKSFLSSLAKNVQLAKGGGWKMKDRDQITKLGLIESGFSLPRDYFVFPDYYEMEESKKMRVDWTDEDFAEIQKSIGNEQ